MSIEVSRPLLLTAPPLTESPAKSRRDAPPPAPTTTRVDAVLNRVVGSRIMWLSPILLLQIILCVRLTNGMSEDEALEINAGHQMIAHLLHGAPAPAFGQYFAGVPALFAVPAAMLDHVGGVGLVRGVNTALVIATTILVYLASRRLFGQGAAIAGAAVFAVNPATIFAARFASVDAPCMFALAAGLYVALRAPRRGLWPLLAGGWLGLAVAEKYIALLFIPGVLAVTFIGLQRKVSVRRAAITVGQIATATIAIIAVVAALAHNDGHGFLTTVLGGRPLDQTSTGAVLHDAWDYVGVIAAISIIGAAIYQRDRRLAVVLCLAGLIPVAVQIGWHESAALQRNIELSMVVLAPVIGTVAVALVRQGRWLAVRAPVAIAAGIVLLSSGMATSASMIHSWPISTSIDSALRYYVHAGNQRYLVDGSELPAYYLSDVTSYGQWVDTLDQRYAGAAGAQRLRADLQSADYRLVLYRADGATPALDRSMLSTLRTRYTLVAKVPLSQPNSNAYWSLWLAELPR